MSVSREEAVHFLECATRNWANVPPLSEDDIGDVASELLRWRIAAVETADASRIDGGRFEAWTLMDFAAECRAQSREQLDPDFSRFMAELAKRLTALSTGGRQP
ncbi:hypothetical protein [Shinella pollutisoli]|uniref:Uncharacterized protein n=1 Tax=Shinella pollutisoli TaxID=2250594 RepID=A0ABV7DKA8_9HYPH|nr:hypothetical protein [Shinella pollutisoli]